MTDDRAALEAFTGQARLFPLPNLVLFPHVDQGLHIFEHRYRQMTADALASDQLIAIVLLRPDWEKDYDQKPAIEQVACLGRITHSEKLIDGRYNLRLRGLGRIRIREELPTPEKLYRIAECEILAEPVVEDVPVLKRGRAELRQAVLSRFEVGSQAHKQLAGLFESETALGTVCDMLGYSLPIPLRVKQAMLEELDVVARLALLVNALAPKPPETRDFPPTFSSN